MESDYLISFLEEKQTTIIKKKRHTYLSYHGLEEAFTYILKEGVVKTSIILKHGQEFNLSYIVSPDIISLLKDEVSNYTSAPFNVRIESEEASFYRVPRATFWEYIKLNPILQDYVRDYYRKKLSENIEALQNISTNGKKGAVCAFIYKLVGLFGKQEGHSISINFQVTNEDIAGFCGISTRNSVNRIIHDLKKEKVIDIQKQKIIILDFDYLENYISK